MPRPRKWPPTIRTLHGRDYLRIDGQDLPLGPTGSAEARAEYSRWLAILQANGGRLPRTEPCTDLSVQEALLHFTDYADKRYASKRERNSFKEALRPVVRLFGTTPLAEFGPRRLSAVRAELAVAHCRRSANKHLSRIKLVFRWLAAQELLPSGRIHDLLTVRGLAHGEGRESDPVLPVPESDLKATLPYLGPILRAAIEVQLLTACRPGELVLMRPCDLLREV